MKYFNKTIEGKNIFVTHEPYAWFLSDNDTVSGIAKSLDAPDDKLIAALQAKESFLRRVGPEHLTRNGVVTLTNRCNMKCSHCYVDTNEKMRANALDVPFSHFCKFVDFLIEEGNKRGCPPESVQLFGGEPTLHRDFVAMATYIRDRGVSVRVSTNAVSKRCHSGEFDHLYEDQRIEWRISLESNRQHIHDMMRPHSFDKVRKNIEYMKSKGALISIQSVIGQHNSDHFEEIIDFAHELGANYFSYKRLGEIGVAKKNGLTFSNGNYELIKRVHKIAVKRPDYIKMLRGTPFFRYLGKLYGRGYSVAPSIQYVMNPDGSFFPSDQVSHIGAMKFGDISTGTFSIDHIERFQEQFEINNARCSSCVINAYCPGGDLWDIFDENGVDSGEYSDCEDRKKAILYLMSLGDEGISLLKRAYSN